jgi:transcriptional regulator with GAF, ATPase, and Fis domain
MAPLAAPLAAASLAAPVTASVPAVSSTNDDTRDFANAAGRRAPLTLAGASTGTTFDVLLRTIADDLDTRRLLPRISDSMARVLSHDALVLAFVDRTGYGLVCGGIVHASTPDAFPACHRITIDGGGRATSDGPIVDDLRPDHARARLASCDPPDLVDRLIADGFRSLLHVRATARQQPIALLFFSKQTDAYTAHDVATARQVASVVALAVAHEQLLEIERHRANVRPERERHLDRRFDRQFEGAVHVSPIGQSPAWRDAVKKATQVASTETTVLLQGESGTGKEVLARVIHRASPRRAGPFVAINCAALPDHLLESELFGYERGAFTGAAAAKPGQIELASGGVLFLDEVSEMSPAAQAKLLRVLQEREFLRLGGTRLMRANVRVIAATNKDLREAVARGAFREDLYYRLQVFDITLPPLRDRASDIPLLVDALLDDISRSIGRRTDGVTPDALRMLLAYAWPGNVRELRNVLERASILCESGPIAPPHLSLYTGPSAVVSPHTTDLGVVERRTIEQVLRETEGNKSRAARRLGLSRMQLYGRLRKYEIMDDGVSIAAR